MVENRPGWAGPRQAQCVPGEAGDLLLGGRTVVRKPIPEITVVAAPSSDRQETAPESLQITGVDNQKPSECWL